MAQNRQTNQRKARPPQTFEEAVERLEAIADASDRGELANLNDVKPPIELSPPKTYTPRPVRLNHRTQQLEINPYDLAVIGVNILADFLGLRRP